MEVIKLLADGLETAAIAQRLNYSERTIKNIIYGAMSRLQLRKPGPRRRVRLPI
ncbi:LuxR C-terminal-related transcriptional regulator [Streptomyces lydicus]|uniref:LuxR C-terminal-related transcriptional regulator n=1 Tax=Streptomyces lydicus TaxID=47763 RepID=UPI0019D6E68C|nr:LuxR C-terminal-related transcriptional regulator [Streptomyces lydicus]